MRFNPELNPQKRRSPTPRPDYAVLRNKNLVAILDAKYRDLWERRLPRDMLYQLVVYAVSNNHLGEASILYPTLNALATEAQIEVNDPVHGRPIGAVNLRPINLNQLERMISNESESGSIERRELARKLAFGMSSKVLK